MAKVKERFFKQEGFEDEIGNVGDFIYNFLKDLGQNPDKKDRKSLIEKGIEMISGWSDFYEVTKDGKKIK
jgi:hypothetical protein